ncbi:MAG: SHOCT domain-containing protein [Candidatus Dormibacteria bacterium]|jgi:uncharacterized membrane protein
MDTAQPGPINQVLNGPYPFAAGHGGYDAGVSVLAIVLRFTLWVLVILAVVWFVREVLRIIQARSHPHAPRPPSAAVAELEMRYARGEINRADYLGRRADLGGPPPPAAPAA